MLVLAIMGILAAVGGAGWGLWRFNKYADDRFDHQFFTFNVLVIGVALTLCVTLGRLFWESARHTAGDPLNGLILMSIGAIGALALMLRNVRRTNVVFGLAGSALQLSMFSVVAALGLAYVAIMVAVAVLGILGSLGALPVRIS